MAGIFKNYEDQEQLCSPDNRHRFCDVDKTDDITIGATAEHLFRLDFDYAELCDGFCVTYSQGVEKVLEKSPNSAGVELRERDCGTDVIIKLTAEETRRFKAHRDTKAQLKLFLNTGEVFVGDANDISVHDSLYELPRAEQEA